MPDFVEALKAARLGPTVALHTYYSSGSHEDVAHVFVEGEEDEVVYRNFIKKIEADARVSIYICDGRDGVLDARSRLKGARSHAGRHAFLVDRDFGLPKGVNSDDRELYVTEHYSVEYDVISIQTFVELFEFRAARKMSAEELELCGQQFEALDAWLKARSYVYSSMAYDSRKHGFSGCLDTPPIGAVYKVSDCGVARNANARQVCHWGNWIDGSKLTRFSYATARGLRNVGFQSIFRGKYYAGLAGQCVTLVMTKLKKLSLQNSRVAAAICDDLTKRRLLVSMAPHADVPNIFSEFWMRGAS